MNSLWIFLWIVNVWAGDQTLYTWIHDNWRSPVTDVVFPILTHTMDKEAQFGLWAGMMVLGGPETQRFGKVLAIGGLAQTLTVTTLKFLTNRPRPEGASPRYNSSFPSGHSAAAFYWATMLASKLHRYKVPLYLWATGVALSRVYLGRHWPTDVLVGGLIGYGFARFTLDREVVIGDWRIWP